jgi:segregation and condensation protein B
LIDKIEEVEEEVQTENTSEPAADAVIHHEPMQATRDTELTNPTEPANLPDAEPSHDLEAAGTIHNPTHTPETDNSPDLDDSESEDILIEAVTEPAAPTPDNRDALKAVIEAAIYITDEPLSAEQIANSVEQPLDRVKEILAQLVTEYMAPDRGLSIREIAGGYKMATKPEHHEPIRRFVKKLQSPLKLSLAALETLAVIAYRQPITGPEVLDVRGVQGAGVLKTLLDRKLIAAAGRKNVLGKPMMYKTTREFLIQFGLNSLAELPTLKEFEELGRMALAEGEDFAPPTAPPAAQHNLPLTEPTEPVAESTEPPAIESNPSDA